MCVIYDWTSAQQANKGFSGGEAKEVFSTDTDVKHDPENEKKIQDGGQNQKLLYLIRCKTWSTSEII